MTKKPTLTIYRGLPGSRKTTDAELHALWNNGRVVGRDHIRKLLGFQGIGTPEQEKEVTDIQTSLIEAGLQAGENVYVDDMNLRSKYVARLLGLAETYGASVEIRDLTNIPLDDCIRSDYRRGLEGGRKVGKEVIVDLYNRFIKGKGYPLPVPEAKKFERTYASIKPYEPDQTLPRAVLIDLDGTVAIHTGIRDHHDYDKVYLDEPNRNVIRMVRAVIAQGYYPVFVSGRPYSCFTDSCLWIVKHVTARGFELLMRKTGDHRPDWIVKSEIFDAKIRNRYYVVAAFDDRNQVVDMYRHMGLTVLQVAPGDF